MIGFGKFQRELLEIGVKLLKPGGIMTFSKSFAHSLSIIPLHPYFGSN